jgi:S-adenosylmethionine decarboxylase
MALKRSLAQLGMDWDNQPRTTQADNGGKRVAHLKAVEPRADHFVERDGMVYAGTHLIVDLWGATRLDDIDHIDAALRECVEASGATLLHIHLHHFTPNGGVSGVAVLAESHISIHTWPERDYAALDVFMCGDARPHDTIPVLRRAFAPEKLLLTEQKRGCIG